MATSEQTKQLFNWPDRLHAAQRQSLHLAALHPWEIQRVLRSSGGGVSVLPPTSDQEMQSQLKKAWNRSCQFVIGLACVTHHDPDFIRRLADGGSCDSRHQPELPASLDTTSEVYISTELPVFVDDGGGRVVFGCSGPGEGGVYWPMLVEKAAAALVGGYGQLHALDVAQAVSLLTGREARTVPHEVCHSMFDMTRQVLRCVFAHTLLLAQFPEGGQGLLGTPHAYVIAGIHPVKAKLRRVEVRRQVLIKLVDPLRVTHWKGTWGRNDLSWSSVKHRDFARSRLKRRGEVWMELSAFCAMAKQCFMFPADQSEGALERSKVPHLLDSFWATDSKYTDLDISLHPSQLSLHAYNPDQLQHIEWKRAGVYSESQKEVWTFYNCTHLRSRVQGYSGRTGGGGGHCIHPAAAVLASSSVLLNSVLPLVQQEECLKRGICYFNFYPCGEQFPVEVIVDDYLPYDLNSIQSRKQVLRRRSRKVTYGPFLLEKALLKYYQQSGDSPDRVERSNSTLAKTLQHGLKRMTGLDVTSVNRERFHSFLVPTRQQEFEHLLSQVLEGDGRNLVVVLTRPDIWCVRGMTGGHAYRVTAMTDIQGRVFRARGEPPPSLGGRGDDTRLQKRLAGACGVSQPVRVSSWEVTNSCSCLPRRHRNAPVRWLPVHRLCTIVDHLVLCVHAPTQPHLATALHDELG